MARTKQSTIKHMEHKKAQKHLLKPASAKAAAPAAEAPAVEGEGRRVHKLSKRERREQRERMQIRGLKHVKKAVSLSDHDTLPLTFYVALIAKINELCDTTISMDSEARQMFRDYVTHLIMGYFEKCAFMLSETGRTILTVEIANAAVQIIAFAPRVPANINDTIGNANQSHKNNVLASRIELIQRRADNALRRNQIREEIQQRKLEKAQAKAAAEAAED